MRAINFLAKKSSRLISHNPLLTICTLLPNATLENASCLLLFEIRETKLVDIVFSRTRSCFVEKRERVLFIVAEGFFSCASCSSFEDLCWKTIGKLARPVVTVAADEAIARRFREKREYISSSCLRGYFTRSHATLNFPAAKTFAIHTQCMCTTGEPSSHLSNTDVLRYYESNQRHSMNDFLFPTHLNDSCVSLD